MTTELINIGEYRKNISSLWKKSREQNIKYLVLVHGDPVFEVTPVKNNNIDDNWTEYTEKNHKAWLDGREDLKNGNTKRIDFDKIDSPDDFINFLKNN